MDCRVVAKTDANPAPSGYHAHRERQGRRILDAAERLFDEHGLDRAPMADIPAASGVRASTIYQYFSHKDEIVWAILHELFTQDVERANKRMESAHYRTGQDHGPA